MQFTQSVSDAELIQAYKEGNERALEQLIYKHKDKVYTTIYLIVKDKYLAEDLFQETFLKMIKTINDGRYTEQGRFLPFAMRVAHNLCMDHFRKVRNNIPVITEDGRELFRLMDFATESVEECLVKKQVHQSVRDLIEILPEEQREVLVMRIYGDLSFKEIADITSVSINTALGRMRYGLINLRKLIAEKQMVLR